MAARDGRLACACPVHPISIDHVAVRADRVVAEVRVGDERYASTTPALLNAALRRFPHLLSHACVNGKGSTFVAVADNTSIVHLLEHMTIEEQVRIGGTGPLYVGKSVWTDRRRLRARVEVSYADDLVALYALKTAQEWLNAALSHGRF
ncbi:MAG: hypothetical protein Q4B69_00155 [Slackia sp.]|nr:hypothetical protein [Slackia sp.]